MAVVYLAGPMAGCSDEECMAWRNYATEKLEALGYEIRNPMTRDYRGIELSASPAQVHIIVEGDKADIDESDILLANCFISSVGTSMEIIYAWEQHKTVVVVGKQALSPWILYHSDMLLPTLDTAIESIPIAQKVNARRIAS